ncbi:excisionase family DNA-binding protein [Bradyrhizobium oligotrophicum]|uniref:excisionase family DNA-binding protein n=1 Tax=Bradyrhizobium oligotrophicum TaxID=44255 RepID=UPI003EBEAB42
MIKRKKPQRRAYPMPPPGQIALSPDQACAVIGIGRTKLDEAIEAGALRARKFGRRVIIERGDAEAFIRGLPPARPEAR